MTREEELASLKVKLKARRDRPGFAKNVAWIEARIAELEAKSSEK